MKVVGFAQLRNELEKGNLENWFKCMNTICDFIYIFDQNSIDGSLEYYKQFDNVHVISSTTNRFKEEIICKSELLSVLKTNHPDTDYIFWLDGDTLVDGRLLSNDGQKFKELCIELKRDNYQGYLFGHKNLWRSDTYTRMDDLYNWLDEHGVCALWKYSPSLTFPSKVGLHQLQYPNGIRSIKKIGYSLVHRGFATDGQLITRYDTYKANGQSGWALDRLLKEETLDVQKIPYELLPEWFELTDDVNPIDKRKIKDIYNEQK